MALTFTAGMAKYLPKMSEHIPAGRIKPEFILTPIIWKGKQPQYMYTRHVFQHNKCELDF